MSEETKVVKSMSIEDKQKMVDNIKAEFIKNYGKATLVSIGVVIGYFALGTLELKLIQKMLHIK